MFPHYPMFFVLILLLFSVMYCSGKSSSSDDVLIRDDVDQTITITSPGKTFELGFFTPEGVFNERYLGIWYYQSNPKTVVWVANRDKPLSESNGCLAIRDGDVVILDKEGNSYWSTNSTIHRRILRNLQNWNFTKHGPSNSSGIVKTSGRLQLDDTGDLIFHNGKGEWHSFDNPTDTFLPGMNSDGSLSLTSWKTRNNPAPGKFTLQLQQTLLTISNGGSDYWKNAGTDVIPQALSEVLLGNTSDNSTTRLVMHFNGQVQFWIWDNKTGWSLNWSQPKDKCSLNNPCGDFGSCNSENGCLCKCLPGFEPNKPDKWKLGGFSDGCSPKSVSCQRTSEAIFLRLPMMNVGDWNDNVSATDHDCKYKCQADCQCVAYSCGRADCKETGAPTKTRCLKWKSTDLTNLQEEYPEGFTIYVRTTPSDIALTSRDCKPCGTNVIPYPLSTAANCGDPSYFNFYCNTSTGQVGFSTSNGTFKVTAINPEAKNFTIRVKHDTNCDRKHLESLLLPPKHPSLFRVKNCRRQPLAEVEQSLIEVEMVWEPPSEPVCNASKDCHDWPHTTCKAAGGGKMRCTCGSRFRWDGSKLLCVKKVPFPLKAVVACVSGALVVVLLCSIFFIRHVQKRGLAERQGSVEFQGDDTGGIDVPFFDWGSIIAATDNFADENKLGTGGFGAVYKGKLPDGREIAVKRLSSVTGQGIEEFRTEVVLIARLQHRNLVRLLGYCVKADERILLYEYMPNGSLDSYLFDQSRSVFLDWEKRFDVIFGIARGLLYLHQDSRLRIIHRDLKPSNILLDEEMNSKISDFGIARIVAGKQTEGITKRVIGTYGYMSPEYAYEGLFSVKSDVFSFGVVVLETISGRRNSKIFQLENGLNLQGYAWKLWTEDRGLDLMDQALKESCNPSEVLKCIHIGLLCVQEEPSDRPIMSAIVLMLGSENADLPPPKQPAFISKKEPSETASSSSIMDSSFNDVMTFSTGAR